MTGESASAVQGSLDSLSLECTESEDKLANEVANSLDDLANHGRTQSAVGFMRAVGKAAQPIAPTQCAQEMAALLVLMEK